MNRREKLRAFLKSKRLTAKAYAEMRGVPTSVVYKFLQGKDILLSTWDSIDPTTSLLAPSDPTLSATFENVRTIS